MNVLLSFAQFEREVTGERIRDKVAASKRKGMWMGGGLPKGYRVEDRKLLVVPEQAEQVRTIYAEFLKLGGLRELGLKLTELGITATSRATRKQQPISRGALHQILRNPIYVGLIRHKGQCHPGQHAPIIEKPLWDAVQTKLTQGRGERSPHRRSETSPLLGKLFDERGRGLTASYATARGTRYPYYQTRVDDLDEDRRAGLDSRGWRLPAREIERQIGSIVEMLIGDRSAISAQAMAAGAGIDEVEALLMVTAQSSVNDRLAWVERVQPSSDQIRISIAFPGGRSIKLEREIPIVLKRRGCGRRLVIGAAGDRPPQRDPDPRLMKLLRVGMAYWEQLGSDQALNLRDYAKREGVEERFVGRALPLAFLAPDLVEAIVDGALSPEWTAERLLRIPRLPLSWTAQRELLGTR